MERSEVIINSCKMIQRELNRLNKLKCSVDLAGHTLTCFDNTIQAKRVKRFADGDNLDFSKQIVFEFSQYIPNN